MVKGFVILNYKNSIDIEEYYNISNIECYTITNTDTYFELPTHKPQTQFIIYSKNYFDEFLLKIILSLIKKQQDIIFCSLAFVPLAWVDTINKLTHESGSHFYLKLYPLKYYTEIINYFSSQQFDKEKTLLTKVNITPEATTKYLPISLYLVNYFIKLSNIIKQNQDFIIYKDVSTNENLGLYKFGNFHLKNDKKVSIEIIPNTDNDMIITIIINPLLSYHIKITKGKTMSIEKHEEHKTEIVINKILTEDMNKNMAIDKIKINIIDIPTLIKLIKYNNDINKNYNL